MKEIRANKAAGPDSTFLLNLMERRRGEEDDEEEEQQYGSPSGYAREFLFGILCICLGLHCVFFPTFFYGVDFSLLLWESSEKVVCAWEQATTRQTKIRRLPVVVN